MKRIFSTLLAGLILAVASAAPAAADAPYLSYDQTAYRSQVPAPNAYEPDRYVSGRDIGLEGFERPVDMAAGADGLLYVLEASGRITRLTQELTPVGSPLDRIVDKNGQESPLNAPQGLFVDAAGDIYVADSDNGRVVRLSPDGVIRREFTRPEDSTYTAETFRPMKVAADRSGMVYVLVEGVYQGMLVYTPEGEFTSFFGSPPVQVTAAQLLDRMWKRLLSKEARNNMARYVPVSFTNLDMDEKGFIYTCSSYTNNRKEQLRKLNYLGNNVYPFTGNFGESDAAVDKGQTYTTSFVDVRIMPSELLLGLDQTRGRVYVFDQDGNRLFTFGTLGVQVGAFRKAAAVECFGDCIYVLDADAHSITRFSPTEYGQAILTATAYYRDGLYEQALAPWQTVLSMNANYELAYSGIGQAQMKLGAYEEAVRYFRLGHDRTGESKAFEQVRTEVMRRTMPLILTGALLLVAAVLVVTSRRFRERRRQKAAAAGKPADNFRGHVTYLCRTLSRPIETFNEMKAVRLTDYRLSALLLSALFFTEILARQYTGFRFNQNDPNTFNVLIQLTTTVAAFLLYAVANWSLCSIADGDGRFGEIVTFTAYSLTPYILFRLAAVVLSVGMTLNEQVFLNGLVAVGIGWSAFQLFQAMRLVHQYNSAKSVVMIVLTGCGMVIILFILLLLFVLFRQVYAFASGVYNELLYRS